jgi:DNA-binding beta-propeller fold protein YncE
MKMNGTTRIGHKLVRNKTLAIGVALFTILIWSVISSACTNTVEHNMTDTTIEESSKTETRIPSLDTRTPRTYTLKLIEIGSSSEKLLAVSGDIWVLKPGELIKVEAEGSYEQQGFEISPSIGGDDMVFDGQTLWITSNLPAEPSTLTEFDPLCYCIIGQYLIEGSTSSITYGANSIWLSVSDILEGRATYHVMRFDRTTKSIVDSIELESYSQKIGFADDKLWVISSMDNEVSIYDGDDGSLIAKYTTGKMPLDIAFDDTKTWIVNRDDIFVTLIPFTLPESPNLLQVNCPTFPNCNLSGIKINHDFGVWVYSAMAERVYQLDPESGNILEQYEVREPVDLAFNGTGIWVINGDRSRNDRGYTLTRIQP